jgi:hypothetical protein
MPIVSNPTAGDVHVNTPLTNFSQKYLLKAESFIASRAFPNAPVAKESDLFYEFNSGDFLRDEAEERADGTESAGSGFRMSTNPYFCRTYAFHKDVTDRQRANQDSVVQLDQAASQFVTQKLLIRRERIFSNSFMGTGKWTTDLTGVAGAPAAGQFQHWSVAGSEPIKVVRNASTKIHQLTGYRPNKMIVSRPAWDALMDNDEMLSRILGGATTSAPALLKKQMIAAEFEIDEILVMDAVFNDKLADLTDPTADDTKFVGGKDALLYYAPNGVALNEPTAGAQFSWTGYLGAAPSGMRMSRIRAPLVKADRIEGEMSFDYKLTGPDLGYYFSSVVA